MLQSPAAHLWQKADARIGFPARTEPGEHFQLENLPFPGVEMMQNGSVIDEN